MIVILDTNQVIKDHNGLFIAHSIDDIPKEASIVFSIGDTYVSPMLPCLVKHKRARSMDHQTYNIFLKEVDNYYEHYCHEKK